MSIRKAGQVIAGTPNITTGHHVGEIFWTSRLDNKVNGAVDADGAVYSVEAFTGEQSVPELLRKGSLPFVSMEEYESIVSANGSCRAWGWDNGDTFRVPLLKDVYLMAGQAETAGEFIKESLPNHRHFIANTDSGAANSPSITATTKLKYGTYSANVDGSYTLCGSSTEPTLGLTSNANNNTYQDGAKVRPDSVRYRAMVQLSTGVQEDATQLKEYKFNNPHFFGESKWTDVDPKNSSWLVSNGSFHSGRTYGDYYKWLLERMNNGVKGVLSSVMYAYSPSGSGIIFTITSATPKIGMTCYGWSDGSYNNTPISTITSVNQDGTFVASYKGTDYTFERNSAKDQSQCYPTDYDFVINTTDETFRLPLLDGSEDLPSDRYEDLTLQASGSTYVAPANGSFVFNRIGSAGEFAALYTSKNGLHSYYRASANEAVKIKLRVKKDSIVTCDYSLSGELRYLRFIYDKGNGTLYYYVGDTVQDANLINAGEVLDYFSKLNTVHCVVDTFKSGSSWYRVYDDGWVEQGGAFQVASGTAVNISFLKTYIDTNYYINVSDGLTASGWAGAEANQFLKNMTTTGITFTHGYGRVCSFRWQACGYGA